MCGDSQRRTPETLNPYSPRQRQGTLRSRPGTASTTRVSRSRWNEPAAARFSFGPAARAGPRRRLPGPPAPPEDAGTGAAGFAGLRCPAPGRFPSPERARARHRPVWTRSLSGFAAVLSPCPGEESGAAGELRDPWSRAVGCGPPGRNLTGTGDTARPALCASPDTNSVFPES